MNCSEFVSELFRQIGRVAGKIETVDQQNVKAFSGKILMVFQQTGQPLKMEDKVITPFSIVSGDQFKKVSGNLKTDCLTSEVQMAKEWQRLGSLQVFLEMAGLNLQPDQFVALANPKLHSTKLPECM